jgi:hypothetical protein
MGLEILSLALEENPFSQLSTTGLPSPLRTCPLGTICRFWNQGRKIEMAPMTDRLRSGREREWSRYTKKTARSAVLTAIQALSSH